MAADVDRSGYSLAARRVLQWADAGQSRYICAANVHSVMSAYDSIEVRQALNGADLVTPDGMPLVWALRVLGAKEATRVYGPDLMLAVLAKAEAAGIPVGFHGASNQTLDLLETAVISRFPKLKIAYRCAPPFRPATVEEDQETAHAINSSGARILFVGLGAPKQELWMARQKGSVNAVMLGVGAAFDFIAGTKPQAPRWMMRCGLEWFFRLCSEPRRLWRRYLGQNPRFVLLFLRQLLLDRHRTPVES